MKYGVFTDVIFRNKGSIMRTITNEPIVIGMPIVFDKVTVNHSVGGPVSADTESKVIKIKGGLFDRLESNDYLKSVTVEIKSNSGSAFVGEYDAENPLVVDETNQSDATDTFLTIPYVRFGLGDDATLADLSAQTSIIVHSVFYKAITGIYNINQLDDIVSLFGENSCYNQPASNLAYGATLFNLVGNVSFKIFALDIVSACSGKLRSSTETDISELLKDLSVWNKSISKIASIHRLYHIVPLTNNATIQNSFFTHVVSSSSYEERKTRRLYISANITTIDDTNVKKYGNFVDADGSIVSTGDDFNYYADDSVIAGTQDAIVDALCAKARSFNSELVTLVAPDYGKINGKRVEGYFLALVHAAMVSARTSTLAGVGSSMTFTPYNFIEDLVTLHFFTNAQKEALKDNGILLMDKESEVSNVQCYAQNTTDINIVNTIEESLVIGRHFLSKQIIEQLKNRIANGKANRMSRAGNDPESQAYLNTLNQDIMGIRYNYVDKHKIFADLKIIGILPNPVVPGLVNLEIEIADLYPVNRIDATIYVI